MCSARSRITDLTVAVENGCGELRRVRCRSSDPLALAGTFNCRRTRSGSSPSRRSTQLAARTRLLPRLPPRTQYAKTSFRGTLLQQYPKPYNVNRVETGLTAET